MLGRGGRGCGGGDGGGDGGGSVVLEAIIAMYDSYNSKKFTEMKCSLNKINLHQSCLGPVVGF